MVESEPYGSSDMGAKQLDDEPPALSSALPSEGDDPEDPENPSDKKKEKKRKGRRHERSPSKEAEAIPTPKIAVNLTEFPGKGLSEFAESFDRFLSMTGDTHANGRVKSDLLLQCFRTQYLEKQVKKIVIKTATFADLFVTLEREYPCYKTVLSFLTEIQNLAIVPNNPKAAHVSELLADLDH